MACGTRVSGAKRRGESRGDDLNAGYPGPHLGWGVRPGGHGLYPEERDFIDTKGGRQSHASTSTRPRRTTYTARRALAFFVIHHHRSHHHARLPFTYMHMGMYNWMHREECVPFPSDPCACHRQSENQMHYNYGMSNIALGPSSIHPPSDIDQENVTVLSTGRAPCRRYRSTMSLVSPPRM